MNRAVAQRDVGFGPIDGAHAHALDVLERRDDCRVRHCPAPQHADEHVGRALVAERQAERARQQHREREDPEHGLWLPEELLEAREGQLDEGMTGRHQKQEKTQEHRSTGANQEGPASFEGRWPTGRRAPEKAAATKADLVTCPSIGGP